MRIKKAPAKIVNGNNPRGQQRKIPIEKMKVGDMIEAANTEKDKMSFYNAIKHRRNYTKECSGWKFTIKQLSDKKIACIRLK